MSAIAAPQRQAPAGRCAATMDDLVEELADGVLMVDRDGCVVAVNRLARAMLPDGDDLEGRTLAEAWAGDRSSLASAVLGLIEGGVTARATGSFGPDGVLLEARAVPSRAGTIVAFRDLVRQQDEEAGQQLLIRELNHRVKNVFSVVLSMVSVSARRARSADELAKTLEGRIRSLAAGHDMIAPALTAGALVPQQARLRDILATSLGAYMNEGGDEAGGEAGVEAEGGAGTVVLDGTDLVIAEKAIVSFALVFHELTTNALKYGALSNPEGCLRVSWHRDGERVVVTWHETNGPAVTEPDREGFGWQLIRMGVCVQLGGSIAHLWEERGVRITMPVPLSRLTG